jgi:brefeldin A-inhibited guanine nucleotide-exchange protein
VCCCVIDCRGTAYGYLRGLARVVHGGRKRYLIDVVVETICNCRDDASDNVQLQVIKALLTTISSGTCSVHGESLLMSVRACYHIYLVSKNQVNRTTAKATLTQMLNIVFQRMEAAEAMADVDGGGAGAGAGAGGVHTGPGAEAVSGAAGGSGVGSDSGGGSSRPSDADGEARPEEGGVGPEAVAVSVPVPAGGEVGDATAVALSSAAVGSPEASEPGAGGGAGAGAAAGAGAGATSGSSDAAGAAGGDGEGYGGMTSLSGFRSASHRDAFLLFRALCKLSMKGDEDDGEDDSVPDTVALQSKILSLELLLSLLENSGTAFKTGHRFIEVMRKVRRALPCVQRTMRPLQECVTVGSPLCCTRPCASPSSRTTCPLPAKWCRCP